MSDGLIVRDAIHLHIYMYVHIYMYAHIEEGHIEDRMYLHLSLLQHVSASLSIACLCISLYCNICVLQGVLQYICISLYRMSLHVSLLQHTLQHTSSICIQIECIYMSLYLYIYICVHIEEVCCKGVGVLQACFRRVAHVLQACSPKGRGMTECRALLVKRALYVIEYSCYASSYSLWGKEASQSWALAPKCKQGI